MVQYFHIQQFPGLDNGTCDGDIVGAGRWVPAGMIMDHDQGSGVTPDGRLEQFPYVHLRRIDRTFINFDNIQYVITRVEQDDA